MQAWEDFLNKQESLLGKPIVEKWLRCLKVVHFDSGNLYLEAKDSFQGMWFEEHIRPMLKSQFVNSNYRPIKVHLTIAEAPTVKSLKKEKNKAQPPISFVFDKLDSQLIIENFIPGEKNSVIFRVLCQLIGYNPQTEEYAKPTTALGTFNPIYLWGGSGCGKTHLLNALAQALKKQGVNALYARAETFTEHVVAAIRSSEMQAFRKAYRHVDVLLIDDVHIFSRKHATQEEFFHTFNTLHTSGRQLIITANCAPALLQEIEPRLISRFEWGLNVHFEKLHGNELKQVLEKRCGALHFPLSQEVQNFLIDTFKQNKSLHRALEALILRSHLETDARIKRNPQSIDKAQAIKILSDLIAAEEQMVVTPEKIIAVVATVCGVAVEEILSKSQTQECSFPRQIAMYLCRSELKLPFQSVGQVFDRDHSTVMTSIKQIEKKITTSDAELLSTLIAIRNHF